MQEKIKELIDTDIADALKAHGGTCYFIRMDQNVAVVGLAGMCRNCPGRSMTILNVVKPYLMNNIEGLENVILE